MNKLGLIIQREYMTRVAKKSFILITLLSPLIFVALFTLPVLLAMYSGKGEQKKIALKDEAGIFTGIPEPTERATYTLETVPIELLKKTYKEKGYDGVLHIAALASDTSGSQSATYYSDGQLSLSARGQIEGMLEDRIETQRIRKSGYDVALLKSFRMHVDLEQKELAFNDKGELLETEKENSAGIATAIGFISGFIIYIILIFYGAMIMRSVMEEKTNRIVEVIISSVKPIQLMMGKIIGVSAVGLTQMFIWIILTMILTSVVTLFLNVDPATVQTGMPGMNGMGQQPSTEAAAQFGETLSLLKSQNWGYIIPVFLFYFLGGYFIYASLFAAVGSAMGDDMGEGQSLSMVAMFPIIISIIMISPVVENPTGSLARWASIFPLSSPVLMPARIAFEPPVWEVILSMGVLAFTAFFFVWLSARIYRVGILMYVKKATLGELWKWMLYKG